MNNSVKSATLTIIPCLLKSLPSTCSRRARCQSAFLLNVQIRNFSRSRSKYQIHPAPALIHHPQDVVKERPHTEVTTTVAQIYKERIVDVHTCADLYKTWKHTKPRWKHVNPDGINIRVPYIHTGLDGHKNPSKSPTVLALHGAPGSYDDYGHMIPALDRKGASVIVPTFPDLSFSLKTQNFWHSVEEKTDLLKQFLKAVNVNKLDLVIAHSSSMYPLLHIAALDPEIDVKSLVFITPAGCRRLSQLSPFWLMSGYDKFLRVTWIEKFMKTFALFIIKMLRKPSNEKAVDGTVLSMITMLHARYDEAGPLVRQLKEKNVPMMMMFGEKDRLIDRDISYEMAEMLGCTPEKMWVYDGKDETDVRLLQTGMFDGNSKVICFKKGTHFAFKKFPETYNELVLQFMNKYCKK